MRYSRLICEIILQYIYMEKDFDNWNEKKKKTHSETTQIVFYEREVWWAYTGVNVGVEIDGKHELFSRPVIIVRKFNKDMALIVPTTAQDKKENKYYLVVSGDDGKHYTVCLSQIRAISTKRFFRKIGTIDKTNYAILLEKIADMIKGTL
ncbi:MAG: 2,4-dihydroxyhept-2-ene-1,7-dioic acid aldolase [Candidatus Azambacteria bacterium GW2011_GWF2_42_22]|nr:MAG: 2,4-dihydroxyhept-2-ene-1,7-dioic acid aldolase [Candidatus Azambacteria bacterium GW2011_GWF1_41_10]KKS49053.1 MAG: 2,4-dihydroxyhept-2-ene-1,7-dioic acid aldolase [Candidatus Azambacteria bacterium GW2011_GWF2_42_22]KKT03038.1 MAG: 2,4-dihydroxyhept-2-ene-1,7-dioic acid aldolase [Candidatus Azambacteria bacterium GW2011_GWD1_43_18]